MRRRARRQGRVRPQPRGRDLALAGVLFAVLALGFGTPALYVVGVGLMTLVVLAWLLVWMASPGLRVRRTLLDRRPRAGEDLHVDVALAGSPGSRTALRMCDWDIAPGLSSLGVVRVARGAGSGRRLRVTNLRRGEHRLAPARLTVRDPLGLMVSRREFGDEGRILVVPRVVPSTADAHALGDRRLARRASLGEDIAQLDGIREYRPGDPLSRVHWGQTAKRGTLHTKVFHTDDADGRIQAVLCDVHSGDVAPDDTELVITAAASLMHAATSAEAIHGQHALLWAGDLNAPVACGWSDAEARLTRLAAGEGPPLEEMMRRSVRLLSPGAGLVGVTAAPTGGVWEAAKAAHRRGIETVVVVAGRAAEETLPESVGVPLVRATDLDALRAGLAPGPMHGHRRGAVGV